MQQNEPWKSSLPEPILRAVETIESGQADCVLLQPDQPPYPASGRGVRPLLQLLQNDPQRLQGAVLVDKIIGKAAAMLAVLGGVRQVFALTASEPGLAYLAANGIPAQAHAMVRQIVNRTGDGLCPLEQSVLTLNDPHEGRAAIQKTVARLMAGGAKKKEATEMYLGKNIKKLGFGLMRLPMLGGEVDLEQTKQMVDLFLSKGFTYFDTAYGYLDGKSERAVKAALVDRYPRESFRLATKLPAWAGAKTAEEARQMFWTSLERTGAGYFDFYLLHNLGGERTRRFEEYGIWQFVQELKEKGLVRHVGFSFHDKAAELDRILTQHPETEFVQLQINYADWDSPIVESRKCYETARRHGKPVIIMEPVKGGALANLPPAMADILRGAEPTASLSSWALRYAASLDGLVTVLSGMSDLAQMQDNLATMADFQPLNNAERTVIGQVQAALAAVPTVPCTDCRYCMKGCPQGVPIPAIFSAMNHQLIYQNPQAARGSYGFATRGGVKAGDCIGCGQCEAVCPQHIDIIRQLARASELFDTPAAK